MALYAFIYISIALLFSLMLIVAEAGEDLKQRALKQQRDGVVASILVLVWPLTITLMVVLEIFERHKKRQANKIFELMRQHGKQNIDDCIPELSIKELRILHYAHRIGATFLSDKSQKLVQQCLIDKSFEKHFLEKDDGH